MRRAEPGLIGIVLAGGESRRMQYDKGTISFHGQLQAAHCVKLLEPLCESVWVSVNNSQVDVDPYCDLPLIIDDGSVRGPAAGLLAAWSRYPVSTLLVLAVDLPLVTPGTLEFLVSRRDGSSAAVAFRHADGTIEPLCTIWEPELKSALSAALDSPSLRRILEEAGVEPLEPPRPDELVSVNTPKALEAVRRALRGS